MRDASLPAPWGRVATVASVGLFVLLMAGFALFRLLPRAVATPIMWISYTWLGALFLMVLALAVTDLARIVTVRVQYGGMIDDRDRRRASARRFGGGAAFLGIGASAVGMVSAPSPVAVERVQVAIDRLKKSSSGMRIVQLTDVHVGPTIGKDFVESIVRCVNALKPDAIAITGDLVDGSVAELAEHVAPLAKLQPKHGFTRRAASVTAMVPTSVVR